MTIEPSWGIEFLGVKVRTIADDEFTVVGSNVILQD